MINGESQQMCKLLHKQKTGSTYICLRQGLDKTAQIAALWQARFYLQWQAAAAAVHKPQYMRESLVYCGSCTAAPQ